MPTESVQLSFFIFEIALMAVGAVLVFWILFNRAARIRWLGTHAVPYWSAGPLEFLSYLLMLFICGTMLQLFLRTGLNDYISNAVDRPGLEIMVYGAGFHGGIVLGWIIFPFAQRYWLRDGGAEPSPEIAPAPATVPWFKVLLYGSATVAAALPVLGLLSAGWTYVLTALGLPAEPQDTIAIFANTQSPYVVIGMLIVACVLAPLGEELLFRAGIYRFCRQRLGRIPALLISGILFGALHGNWAGFLPLAVLGGILALAYEATGTIRVSMVAHALFNLNTIFVILSGLSV